MKLFLCMDIKKGRIEIQPRVNPISYEKPLILLQISNQCVFSGNLRDFADIFSQNVHFILQFPRFLFVEPPDWSHFS